MNLYLDDERTPKTNRPWRIVRNFEEATFFVSLYGIPNYISFDHDLGEEKTGYDFAKWLVELDLNGVHKFPSNFEFNVHSANPIGAKNINDYLTSYFKAKL